MKICIFSDLHAHPWPDMAGVNDEGVNTRLLDTLSIIKQVHRIAKEKKCELILFAGDLFHATPLAYKTLDLTAMALSQLEIPLVMIPGNHDEASKCDEFHSVRVFNRAKPYIKVLDSRGGSKVRIGGLQIGGVPFVGSNDEFLARYKSLRGSDIVLAHTGFAGASAGFEYIADQKEYIQTSQLRMRKLGIGWTIAGHFHDPQIGHPGEELVRVYNPSKYRLPKGSVLIPGAPLHHTFGDSISERGCWVLDVGMQVAEFIHLRFPRFIITAGVGEKVDGDGIRKIFKGNFVRYQTEDPKQCQPIAELLEAAGARGFRVQVLRSSEGKGASRLTSTELTGEKKQSDLLKLYIKSQPKKGLPATRKQLLKSGMRIFTVAPPLR